MTRVLVLNRFDLVSARYPEWIPDGTEIHLLTSAASLPAGVPVSGYAGIRVVERYEDSGYVDYVADQIQRQHSFDRVIATSEYDLLRAARMSERWNLGGRPLDEVLRYRDKARMKSALDASSVPVAQWTAVNDPASLLTAARALGFPLVVKARRGAASRDVRVLRDEAALGAFLLNSPALADDRPADLLAERYIEGTAFHVDGFVRDGAVVLCWPSETTPNLDLAHGTSLVSTMLEPGDARLPSLAAITERALTALGLPDAGLFHAEVFGSPREGLIVNEVGARLGGGRIKEVLRRAFGVDPLEWYIRTLFGTAGPADQPSPAPLIQAGYAKIAVRAGRVRSVAADCPVPRIVSYYPEVKAGDRLAAPGSSNDHVAALVAVSSTRAEVQAALGEAVRWANGAIDIAEPEDGT